MGKGVGDLSIKASCRLVFKTFSIRDVHYFNDCTSNSVEDYFTVPSAVSSRSIYGFNSDGWKFGNCSSYQRIIGKEKLSEWFNVEFTITEISGFGLIQYIYSNGSTPNTTVNYDLTKSTNKLTICSTQYNETLNVGDRLRIEWRNGTGTLYVNDVLIGSGTHSVTLPTQVEFHTGANRYIRIKDLIIETL